MGGFIANLNQWTLFPVRSKLEPEEQYAFQGILQFTPNNPVFVVDLSPDTRVINLRFTAQSMYVDNSTSGLPVTITFQGTNQTIVVKANQQGYFPLVAQDAESGTNLKLTASMNNPPQNLFVPIQLLNYHVEPFVWSTQ